MIFSFVMFNICSILQSIFKTLYDNFVYRCIVLSGKLFKLACPLKEGIPQDTAKKISKIIRDEGPRSVKAQIQGDELRVQSKSRDDLQATIALLKGSEFDVPLQFINMR